MININAVNLNLQLLNAKANPGQTLIDDKCELFSESGLDLFKKQAKPLVSFLDDASDYPTPGKLFDYYSKMKTVDLEDTLLNLDFASEITGKLVVRDLELSKPKAYRNITASKTTDLIKDLELIFDMSPEDAVIWLIDQGIEISDSWLDTIDIIKKHCFTVAKIQSADLLQAIQNELVIAMDEGIPYGEWKKNIEVILTNKGYYPKDGKAFRLDTVYRMNMQNALMRGRYLEQQEVADSFPWWEFVATLDNRTTTGCKGLNGICLPMDDAFWTTNYPMRHFLCRSTVRSVSKFDLKKRGIKVNKPDDIITLDGVEYKIKDIKPSEGFDNTPDSIWVPDTSVYDKILKEKVEKDLE